MAAKKGTWIGATAFASVALAGGAWLLAISPQIAEGAELREQTESVDNQNDILELAIAKLAAEFEHLDEYKTELAELRLQIPTEARLSAYLRELDAIAAAHAVVVTNLAPAMPQAFVSAVVPAPAPAPTETAEEGTEEEATAEAPTDEATPTTPAVPAGPVAPPGFVAIPVTITVVGTYDNTVAFLSSLQTGTQRLFLLTGITGTSQQPAEASGGRPELALGDQELQLTGFLYTLPDPLGVLTPVPDPSATPTPTGEPVLPVAPPGKNPLVPIAGA
jgi:Tfp pilus assembly protein PilO